jgi:hypothetical protein
MRLRGRAFLSAFDLPSRGRRPVNCMKIAAGLPPPIAIREL